MAYWIESGNRENGSVVIQVVKQEKGTRR